MCKDQKLDKNSLGNRVEGTSRCRKRKIAGKCTPEDLAACGNKNKAALLGRVSATA